MILITYFEKFVSNIQPSEERVSAISEAHNTLRAHLKDDAELVYPVDTSFLSGSYARHTAIDPVKDADIILVLKETEISDDKKTPSPRMVLEDFKKAVDEFYDEVNLETQRRSIQVFLPEDDIRMDIVPAIAPNGKDNKLFVPDYDQNHWIESDPTAHITFARDKNEENNGRFVRAAKAMKWWRTEKLEKEKGPKSFLLEVIVAYNMDSNSSNLCEAFDGILKNILSKYQVNRLLRSLPKVPDPALPEENDLAESCGWSVEKFIYFYDEIVKLSQVVSEANSPNTPKEKTIELWRSVFGDVYPLSLTEQEEKSIRTEFSLPEPSIRSTYPYKVEISAKIAQHHNGPIITSYKSNGFRIEKGKWLKFQIDNTNVPPPYEIRWVVKNHGREARAFERKGDHETFPGTPTQWEHAQYKGHHFMDCEILKEGEVVAKARYVVNIR